MNALENAIKQAITSYDDKKAIDKAYLEFIKANFIIPVQVELKNNEPVVLYLCEGEIIYLPVFTDKKYLNAWGDEIKDKINLLVLSGVDLLNGIGENVSICLNPGANISKIFNPEEIARLKNMIKKLWAK